MANQTIVLVTGSKSGIGKGLLAAYAQRNNTIAVAAIRDGPSSNPAKTLTSLPTGNNSKIIVSKYDASSKTGAAELVSDLVRNHNIQHLDIVIANAGILQHHGPAKDVSAEHLENHFNVNAIAPVLLYTQTTALLNKSPAEPKFVLISSNLGSNGDMDNSPLPMIAYGMSKAAANYALSKISREEERVVALPLHPGWVQTPMGEDAAVRLGAAVSDVPVTINQSVGGLVKVIDQATKKGHSGKFLSWEGEEVPW